MKRKIRYILLLGVLTLTLTGCVKFNTTMDIKKDKSMDFSIIYALNTSVFGDEELLDADDMQKIKDKGFEVTDYNQGGMKGFQLVKKIKNIDEISDDEEFEYNLSGILKEEENSYLFKVEKGFLKNKYTANFTFSTSDSNISSETNSGSNTFDSTTNSNVFDSDYDMDSDFDYSQMMNGMDLKFTVYLPYKAKSHNATEVLNGGKNLSWNLSAEEANDIEFQFSLYNMTNIYLGLALIVIVIAAIIIVSSKLKKMPKDKNPITNSISTITDILKDKEIPMPEDIGLVSETNEVIGSNVNGAMPNNVLSTNTIQNEQQNVAPTNLNGTTNGLTESPFNSLNTQMMNQQPLNTNGVTPSVNVAVPTQSVSPTNNVVLGAEQTVTPVMTSSPLNNQINNANNINTNMQSQNASQNLANNISVENVFNVSSIPENGLTSNPLNPVANEGQTNSSVPNSSPTSNTAPTLNSNPMNPTPSSTGDNNTNNSL